MIRFLDLAMVALARAPIPISRRSQVIQLELRKKILTSRNDREGFADWKWLVDFHARVLEKKEGKRREDQREKVDQSETLDRRRT